MYRSVQSCCFWVFVSITSILGLFSGCSGSGSGIPKIVQITLNPPNATIDVDAQVAFKAMARFSDNTNKDVTNEGTWTSSNPAVATVVKGVVTGKSAGNSNIKVSVSGFHATAVVTVQQPPLQSIEVSPPNPSIAKGTQRQFAATGTYANNTTRDITDAVTWSSSAPNIASVGPNGIAQGLAPGTSTITATLGEISGSSTLTVTQEVLVAIEVTPLNPEIANGTSQQFEATGRFSDDSTQNLTAEVTWASSVTSVATIDPAGLATSVNVGTTTISAEFNGKRGETNLTVSGAALVEIQVTPTNPSIAKGTKQQFSATGVFSDTTTQNMTAQVAWSSSQMVIATIADAGQDKGLASGLSIGSTTITATLGGVSGQTELTVTAAELVRIDVTPVDDSVPLGLSVPYIAMGVYSDQSTQNITTQATWASSVTDVATISNATGAEGVATSVAVGVTEITATLDEVVGTTNLTVTDAALESVRIEPAEPSIPKGAELQFSLIGSFTDETEENLTPDATWSSSNTNNVFISNAEGNQGLATALQVGPSTIRATFGNFEATTLLTVTNAELVEIVIAPESPTVPVGLWTDLQAFGRYTDQTELNITPDVTWGTSNNGIATVNNAENKGRVTGVGIDSATITATLGNIEGSVVLQVTSQVLMSIVISPQDVNIPLGLTQQFTALGTYSDKSEVDVTNLVTWGSSDPFFAVVSNAESDKGMAFTHHAHPPEDPQAHVVVRATHPNHMPGEPPIEAQTKLRVLLPNLLDLEIDPVNPMVAAGSVIWFNAIGYFTDGTRNITGDVNWISSTPATAEINNTGELKGRCLAKLAGEVTITAVALIGADPKPEASTTLTITDATLEFIEVVPPNPRVSAGSEIQFEAWGHYSDFSHLNITDLVTWDSGDDAVVTIEETTGFATTEAAGATIITATLDGVTGDTGIEVTNAVLESIEVLPQNEEIAAGTELQFMALGHYSDGSELDLTADAVWDSSLVGIATIDAAGLALGVSQGMTTITATFGSGPGVSGHAVLNVTLATLTMIEVMPGMETIALGSEIHYHAIGHFSNSTVRDVTPQVTWSSSDETVAIISNSTGEKGRAVSQGAGETTIAASFQGVEGDTTLTVTAAVLQAIIIEPPEPSIANGTEMQFEATGLYSDGSTQDLTDQVTWESDDQDVATISNADESQGLATSQGVGTAAISASMINSNDETISATTPLHVTGATITDIEISPLVPEIAAGTLVWFEAIAHLTDGTTQEFTHAVTWSSSDSSVAVVSNAPSEKGRGLGIGAGTATIKAKFMESEATTTITVTDATLVFIEVHPVNRSISAGLEIPFEAFGHYTDNSVQNITGQVTWTSSDESVATISNAEGENGLLLGVAAGGVTITATLGEVSGDTGLEVTDATLTSIDVTPYSAEVAKGTEQQFVAMGQYTDGSTQEITEQVSWSSSNTAVAIVSNSSDSKGLASTVTQGSSTITATMGETSGNAMLTVTIAVLESIDVEPGDATIALGTREHFVAIGHFSDATTRDITNQVTWTSSDETVASISNATGDQGWTNSVAAGSVTISASYLQDDTTITGTASLTVTAATLNWIEVGPMLATIPSGTTLQYEAFGHYSDGTSQEITTQVTWSSTTTSVAEITNADGDQGMATAVSEGTTTIQATLDEVTGQTDLHVRSAVLTSIEVSPLDLEIALGTEGWFEAIGHYTDGSSQEISHQVSWSSSDASVATVSNAPGEKGRAFSEGQGEATITATFDELSGEATLVVSSATLVELEVMPRYRDLPAGGVIQFEAFGFYSDGSHQNLTEQVSWSTSDGTVATISNVEGDMGLASAVAAGTVTITAALDEETSATAELTVTAAVLEAIEVAPQYESIAKGTTLGFEAWGHYSNGTSSELTDQVIWSSSATAVAVISNGDETRGQATGVAQGMTTIGASFEGVDGATVLTVTQASLVEIEIAPTNPQVAAGTKMQAKAIGHFSDATTHDITGLVTWSSEDATIVTVSNADDEKGMINAVGENQSDDAAMITAKYGEVSGTTIVTVTSAILQSIEVNPYSPEIAAGTEVQLNATGFYSDGSAQDITEQVTWTSNDPSIAVVSNQDEHHGLLTGNSQGTVLVYAKMENSQGSLVSGDTNVTVTTAILTSIEVIPGGMVVAAGTKGHFQAFGYFSDNTGLNITGLVSWTTDDEDVAQISNATGEKGLLTGITEGSTTVTATFGEVTGQADLEVTSAILHHIDVTPYSAEIADGTKIEFTATGFYSDNTVQNITAEVQWGSSDASVAVISNQEDEKGVATGIAMGNTTISASMGDKTASASLQVNQATLEAIEVVPFDPTIAAGTKIRFRAFGHFSDGVVLELTHQVAWTSSDTDTAVINSVAEESGFAIGIAQGSCTITATMGEVSGTADLTVSAANLVFIEVMPYKPSIAAGTGIQMTALGHYTDYSVQDITDQVVWSSSLPDVAVASNLEENQGWATGFSVGAATITARMDETSASTVLAVTSAVLNSIEVLPNDPHIALGTKARFHAIGHFSDGTAHDISSHVAWGSSDTSVAVISNADGEWGLAESVAQGTATITATHAEAEISSTASITVTPATVVFIEVAPHNPSIANGTKAHFQAFAHFSDGTHQDVTPRAAWSSLDETKVVVSNAEGEHGVATAIAVGSTTIQAMFGGETGDTGITVTSALLQRLEITPYAPYIALGTHVHFRAFGHFSDNTVHDLTGEVEWTSSDTSVGVISNVDEEAGLATSVAQGTTTITARFDETSIATILEVTNPTLNLVEVNPFYPEIADGTTIQFFAYAHFSDGTVQDVTEKSAWGASDSTVAVVSNVEGEVGLAIALDPGTTNIVASFEGTSGQASLTVTLATLQEIHIEARTFRIADGTGVQFHAIGAFSDDTIHEISHLVTWESSDETVATISNGENDRGWVQSVDPGSATIYATFEEVEGSVDLTVTSAILNAVEVTPHVFDAGPGAVITYIAFAHYSDGTHQDVTPRATWGTSATSVAVVSNAPGTIGVVTTVAAGSATVTASFNGTSGSADLTVTAATVDFLEVVPQYPSIALGTDVKAEALLHFTDYHILNVTHWVRWGSSDATVAVVSNRPDDRGRIVSVGAGSCSITATFVEPDGTATSASTLLTVTSTSLQSITITPAAATIPQNLQLQFFATGNFADGSEQDLTPFVVWGSTATASATVSNEDGTRGLVRTHAAGSTNITATFGGASGTADLTVSDETLSSIAISPDASTIPVGYKRQFTATANFSGGTSLDITQIASWVSSDAAVVKVDNEHFRNGVAVGITVGSATLTAYFGGTSGSSGVSVTSATLASIAVTPSQPAIGLGDEQAFVATGTFSDQSSLDMTFDVAWLSDDESIAVISNLYHERGVALGVDTGSATISAVDPRTALSGNATLVVD